MTGRTSEDFAHERTTIDAAHQQNETQRDSFVALAHTALFAASVSFVGSVTPLRTAIWKPILILGWTSSVSGLLALTFSFHFARKAIDARRAALNDADPPGSPVLDLLNATSLWSFPISLLCLFLFVTANVVSAHEPPSKPTVTSQSAVATQPVAAAQPVAATHSASSTQSAVPALPAQRGNLAAGARAIAGACPAAAQPDASVDRRSGVFTAAPRTHAHRTGWSRPRRRHSRSARAHPDAAPATPTGATVEEVTSSMAVRRCY